MPSKPTLLLDFDGVLHQYTGEWSPILNAPITHARRSCLLLSRHFRLVCFTTRKPSEDVSMWLHRHGFPPMEVTDRKVPAHAIIDDRGICFPGMWTDAFIKSIVDFHPHWRGVGEVPFSPSPTTAE